MGKMKEIFMQIIEQEYNGNYDKFTEEKSKEACSRFIYLDDVLCSNCSNATMHRSESDFACDTCGQEYIEVNNSLRFK